MVVFFPIAAASAATPRNTSKKQPAPLGRSGCGSLHPPSNIRRSCWLHYWHWAPSCLIAAGHFCGLDIDKNDQNPPPIGIPKAKLSHFWGGQVQTNPSRPVFMMLSVVRFEQRKQQKRERHRETQTLPIQSHFVTASSNLKADFLLLRGSHPTCRGKNRDSSSKLTRWS